MKNPCRRMDDQIESGAKRLAYLAALFASIYIAYLVHLALAAR
jgi:hypothetical protein